MPDRYENATAEELLVEAMQVWRCASESLHQDRCAHDGGVEVCDSGLTRAERRAAQLGIDVAAAPPVKGV